MAKLVTEFIGTFFLVLTIALTVVGGSPLAPLAIGSVLMVMVYMGGHISGAHYNPAVTLAMLIRRKVSGSELLSYWAAQITGALAASVIAAWVTGVSFAPAPSPDASSLHALTLELLFTFALALVVLNTAVAPATKGNSFYGLAIGFTLGVGAAAGGPISGGAFNPAVGIGPIVVATLTGAGDLAQLWLYLVGPFAGSTLAAFVYGLQNADGP
jgi:aquaporin Z